MQTARRGGVETRSEHRFDGPEIAHPEDVAIRQPLGHDQQVDVRIGPRHPAADRSVHRDGAEALAVVAPAGRTRSASNRSYAACMRGL